MARELIQQDATWCDLHAALPTEPRIDGTTTRTLEGGDEEVDLCDPCALIFDLVYPRREAILPLLQTDVFARLQRSGRNRNVRPRKNTADQLALLSATTSDPEPPATKKKAPPRKKPANGAWREDVVQVLCPLDHRKGAPKDYWVSLRDRGSHARSHKDSKGRSYAGPEIAFKLQPDQKFDVFCYEHEACAAAGGYGFLNEEALRLHANKTKTWPRASRKARDAAKTRRDRAA